MRSFPLCLIFPVLAGCVQPVDDTAMVPSDLCGAAALQGLVGQPSTVLQTMKFAHETRIIEPNSAVTLDHRPDRLNIHLDQTKTISRVDCG